MEEHINKYLTTNDFKSEFIELNSLKHFVAYDYEKRKVFLKKKIYVRFNIVPSDATINYSIGDETYFQTIRKSQQPQFSYLESPLS